MAKTQEQDAPTRRTRRSRTNGTAEVDPKVLAQYIGERLREARSGAGMSQSDVATKIGSYGPAYVGQAERGKGIGPKQPLPAREFVQKAIEVLNLKPEDVLPEGVEITVLKPGSTARRSRTRRTDPAEPQAQARAPRQPGSLNVGEVERLADETVALVERLRGAIHLREQQIERVKSALTS